MTPLLYTKCWFYGSDGESFSCWCGYKFTTDANLFMFLQKGWNPHFVAPASSVKHTIKNNVFKKKKKKATDSQRSNVHWMRLRSVHCPPGICSLDRSRQALCSWINACRHCKVFHTCWGRFLDRAWRRAACTEGWRPVGDRKTEWATLSFSGQLGVILKHP